MGPQLLARRPVDRVLGGLAGQRFHSGSSQGLREAANGGRARLVQTTLVATFWPIWAPDSKRLLVVGKPDTKQVSGVSVDWWVVPLNGGAAVKTLAMAKFRKQNLTAPFGYDWITPIAWLPGQNRVLFSAMSRDTTNLWEIPISNAGRVVGPAERHTLTTLTDLHASVVPEQKGPARRMLFSSLAGNVNVWSLPIDANTGLPAGEMEKLIPDVSYSAAPSISVDGTKLVFISARSNTWSVRTRDLATGKEAMVASAEGKWLRARISPDGETVAYVDNPDHMYVVNTLTGMAEKICERCGPPTDVSAGGQQILFEPLDPPDYVMRIDVPGHRTAPMIRTERADHILYAGRFAPGGHWVVFVAALDKSLNKKIFISPVEDGQGVSEAEWIPVTDGSRVDLDASWSPDGNLLYFLSERDGFRCIWAQRLHPDTKRPVGDAFAVQHFHRPRRSLARVDRAGLIGLSAARGRLVFAMSELTGNIWMEERNTTANLGWFRRWMPITFR